MKTEYTVVEESDRSRFVAIVGRMLNSGWKLVGGVSVAARDSGWIAFYAQAMVRETAQKDGDR